MTPPADRPSLSAAARATPCPHARDLMPVDRHGDRWCPGCGQQIHDLDTMTDAQLVALLEARSTTVERLYLRADGGLQERDCQVGVVLRRRRSLALFGSMVLLLIAGSLGRRMSSSSRFRQLVDGVVDRLTPAPPARPSQDEPYDLYIEGDDYDRTKEDHTTGGFG